MNDFMFWSGVVAWLFLGVAGILYVTGIIMEWMVDAIWSRKEFLAFVADRLRKKSKHT